MDKKELRDWFDSKIESYIHQDHYDGSWKWEQFDNDARGTIERLIESSGERIVSREQIINCAVLCDRFAGYNYDHIKELLESLGFEVKP